MARCGCSYITVGDNAGKRLKACPSHRQKPAGWSVKERIAGRGRGRGVKKAGRK